LTAGSPSRYAAQVTRGVKNAALQSAIFLDPRDAQTIAADAGLKPPRLSHAVYGRRTLTKDEQTRVAQVLKRPRRALFP
jgi:hypothetical protein